MKLTIQTKLLTTALASLKSIAKPSALLPILSNVALSARDGELSITGQDLEKQLSIKLACDVKESGETTVSCARLHDWLSSRPEQTCEVSVDTKHKTTIRAGKATSNLAGLPPNEFPPMLDCADGKPLKLSAALFSKSISTVLTHSSLDKSRGILMSVLFCESDGKVTFVGCDGRRLARMATDADCPKGIAAIIPRESAATMATMSTVGDLEILVADNLISVKSDNQEFVTKLIEGNYPNFRQVIPNLESQKVKVTINRKALLSEIDSAIAVCGEIKAVRMASNGTELTVAASESQAAQYESIGAIEASGGSIEIGLNPVFLRDMLKCAEPEDVTLLMNDARSPIMISEGFLTAVAMPIRVG